MASPHPGVTAVSFLSSRHDPLHVDYPEVVEGVEPVADVVGRTKGLVLAEPAGEVASRVRGFEEKGEDASGAFSRSHFNPLIRVAAMP